MKIAIIGAGNIGRALAGGMLTQAVVTPKQLALIDSCQEQIKIAQASYGCQVGSKISELNFTPNCVILAVKPADSLKACAELSISQECLVISVMAGVSVNALRKMLAGHNHIIRCMPNLAAAFGKSITCYYVDAKMISTEELNNQIKQTETILSVLGEYLRVQTEELLDAATAIAGSGPAYFFYFVEILISSAMEIGFTKEEATQLVLKTLEGASTILNVSESSPATERTRVTSKGGTTEAALAVLEQGQLDKLIKSATKAAFERARILSRNFN